MSSADLTRTSKCALAVATACFRSRFSRPYAPVARPGATACVTRDVILELTRILEFAADVFLAGAKRAAGRDLSDQEAETIAAEVWDLLERQHGAGSAP